MRKQFLSIIAVLCCTVVAYGNLIDTLRVDCYGGANIRGAASIRPSGSTAGIARLQVGHRFSEKVTALLALRASTAVAAISIEEALVSFTSPSYLLSAGFLSDRLGAALLYRPHSPWNPYVETPVLLRASGFGLRGTLPISLITLQSGVMMNIRENGNAYLAISLTDKSMVALSVLGGFESYSMETQDNSFYGGVDVSYRAGHNGVHAAVRYDRYVGYDQVRNPSMVAGMAYATLVEWQAQLFRVLSISGLVSSTYQMRRFEHRYSEAALDLVWHCIPQLGIGPTLKTAWHAELVSTSPGFILNAFVWRDQCTLSLEGLGTITRGAATQYELQGSLWFAF